MYCIQYVYIQVYNTYMYWIYLLSLYFIYEAKYNCVTEKTDVMDTRKTFCIRTLKQSGRW